ncbi:MAG: GHKL domain-containing protein [Alphaproteobacteria bacterium]|nr:GHKL domain-containing protein [Alphaproteobacteria bacterium]
MSKFFNKTFLTSWLILLSPIILVFSFLFWYYHESFIILFASFLFIALSLGFIIYPVFSYFNFIRKTLHQKNKNAKFYKNAFLSNVPLPIIGNIGALISKLIQRYENLIVAITQHSSLNKQIISNYPYPTILLNQEKKVIDTNEAFLKLLQSTIKTRYLSITGYNFTSIFRHPDLIRAIESVLNDREQEKLEFSFFPLLERQFIISITKLFISYKNHFVLIVMQDITQIKLTEKLRRDFIANASHELRTPLSILKTSIETLRTDTNSKLSQDIFNIMNNHACRMQQLIDDLLSLSKIELNEMSQPSTLCDLGSILNQVITMINVKAQSKNINIKFDEDYSSLWKFPFQQKTMEDIKKLPKICGDEQEIFQLFQNIIDNAIKYSASHTTIKIVSGVTKVSQNSTKDFDHVFIAIIDNGYGIEAEHIPRLTERFYRVDKSRSIHLGGTGLGLAIVKHILNHHQGFMDIQSKPKQGSNFCIFFPISFK